MSYRWPEPGESGLFTDGTQPATFQVYIKKYPVYIQFFYTRLPIFLGLIYTSIKV